MHLHLVGAMRLTTLVELTTQARLTAPDPRAFTTFPTPSTVSVPRHRSWNGCWPPATTPPTGTASDTFALEPFARAFAIAREAALAGTPHAGELAGPCSVRAAVDQLGATRIARGIGAVEDVQDHPLIFDHGATAEYPAQGSEDGSPL